MLLHIALSCQETLTAAADAQGSNELRWFTTFSRAVTKMKALTTTEAIQWCKTADLDITRDDELRYPGSKLYKFFIPIPVAHPEIVMLAREILFFRGESNYSGAIVWLRRWDIGSPQLVHPGWLVLESIRRANGDQRPLDIAPAQSFRDDELVAAHAFLIQIMGFGWVAEFVSSGEYFLHFKDNLQISCTANDAATSKELRNYYQRWEPTDEDPMVVKMAEMERSRRRTAGKLRSR